MNTIEAILTRRSIRKYKKEAITQKEIDQLIRAAMSAPSTINNRDWAFVIVDAPKVLNALADGLNGNAEMLREAPLAIVVCGDLNLALKSAKEFWIVDACLAAENILLTAHDMGLGSVYLGVFPREIKMQNVSKTLNLPDHLVPLTVLPSVILMKQNPRGGKNPMIRRKFTIINTNKNISATLNFNYGFPEEIVSPVPLC